MIMMMSDIVDKENVDKRTQNRLGNGNSINPIGYKSLPHSFVSSCITLLKL